MTVYVDDAAIVWRGKPRFHLCADSPQELHQFAAAIGVRPCWFHRGARFAHYDITAEQRQEALAAGAVALESRELVRLLRTRRAAMRGELLPEQP